MVKVFDQWRGERNEAVVKLSYLGKTLYEMIGTVLCKSNDSEFRRISTKFYEILCKSAKISRRTNFRRNCAGLYCFTINEISCRCAKFHLANSLKVAKFVLNFVSASEISFEISQVGAKFQTKFPTLCLCERNFERQSRLEIEISFTICGHYTRVTKCRMQTAEKKKQFTDGSPC